MYKIKRIFLDTNIVLDLLGKREPFFESIAKITTMAEMGIFTLVVSALSYSTVNYVLGKTEQHDKVISNLRKFKTISTIGSLNNVIVEKALNSDFVDFEDALQYFCDLQSNCEVILARNCKDFKLSTIPVMTADAFFSQCK
ncbi:MAG: PIN domain-containing protein [Prevotellaceae bacterium]|jgi:predicted nucleic acid-binding protein|nr:PIN domain-containing protein [Prevotellaceae bacterium]